MVRIAESQIAPKHQQAIADILGAIFGTPDQPYALPQAGLDQRLLKMAAGPVWSNEAGDKHGLYRRHCAHCHGITGDGQGPTAAILNPYPRDYRRGLFKFKGTFTAAKPTDDDLRRIINNGVPGTAMPAFKLLPPDEVDALVEYVKYLSIRGQMDPELKTIIIEMLTEIVDGADGWNVAGESLIAPAEDAIPAHDRTPQEVLASVNAGRDLFYGPKANCVKCHGPTGLGDGQQDNYDDWSAVNQKFIDDTRIMMNDVQKLKADLADLEGDERNAAEEELDRMVNQLALRDELLPHILPPRRAIPRNLREGSYRGGRRDIDLFWRVFAGIPGMGMPASGPAAPGGQGTLTEQEMWQIVDYIQSLPFEPNSEPQIRPVNIKAVN
jgi:mono/diheme cytochrome c family protein